MKKSIKWRATSPVYRAGITAGTIVGLIAATGAPMKWSFLFSGW